MTNTIPFTFQVKDLRLWEVRELIQSYRAPKWHSWDSDWAARPRVQFPNQ